MNRSVILAIALALAAACSDGAQVAPPARAPAAGPTEAPVGAEANVKALMIDYRDAIVAGKGTDAVDMVSQRTIAYFDSMRLAALAMPAAEVKRADVMDQLMILTLRGHHTRAELEGSNGRALFVVAVEKGWTGSEVRSLEPGVIKVDGDTAQIGMIAPTGTLPPAMGFRAYLEDGRWKLDIMSIAVVAGPAFEASLEMIDPDRERAMLKLLGMVLKKPVDATLWEPLAGG